MLRPHSHWAIALVKAMLQTIRIFHVCSSNRSVWMSRTRTSLCLAFHAENRTGFLFTISFHDLLTSDGLKVPVEDMEEFCGQTAHLFVFIDENNFVTEIQEADNIVSLSRSTPVTISGQNCNSLSQNQECKYFSVAMKKLEFYCWNKNYWMQMTSTKFTCKKNDCEYQRITEYPYKLIY